MIDGVCACYHAQWNKEFAEKDAVGNATPSASLQGSEDVRKKAKEEKESMLSDY